MMRADILIQAGLSSLYITASKIATHANDMSDCIRIILDHYCQGKRMLAEINSG